MSADAAKRRALLAEARQALGIEHLVLAIHDASFPCRADDDLGRGTPYGRGARDLLEWALDRGFTGVQLGPQGETSRANPSPYDGTAFAKTILSIDPWALACDPKWEGVLSVETLGRMVAAAPRDRGRMHYTYVYDATHAAIRETWARIDRGGPLFRRFEAWRAEAEVWLGRDARFEALALRHGTEDWRTWPHDADAPPDAPFMFGQFVVSTQHAELLAWAERQGLTLFGDLAIGISQRDQWEKTHLFLRDLRMGAPPSRTNPDGQPWAYPVLVPGAQEGLDFVRARAEKMLRDFHGLRIDHPHGHVCPWVYRHGDGDPIRAVNAGARLHESPRDPSLAAFAIARDEQIDRSVVPYGERWVIDLDEAQVDAYARTVDALVAAARSCGRDPNLVLFEVLSTCPYPLHRVMRRYGVGRFRVTQKADPRDPHDVYSTHRAERGDWVMLGNHDTPPIWLVVDGWSASTRQAWCDHLASRLGEDAIDRAAVVRDAAALAQPMLADLFASDAGRISVFFADLFGERAIYNVPGVVRDDNWTLRVPPDFAAEHERRRIDGRALDVPLAVCAALRARDHVALAERIEELPA